MQHAAIAAIACLGDQKITCRLLKHKSTKGATDTQPCNPSNILGVGYFIFGSNRNILKLLLKVSLNHRARPQCSFLCVLMFSYEIWIINVLNEVGQHYIHNTNKDDGKAEAFEISFIIFRRPLLFLPLSYYNYCYS